MRKKKLLGQNALVTFSAEQMMRMVFSSLSLLALGASSALASADQPIYLVTGATGGTGQLIYGLLRDQDDVIVRALVTNVTKAREYLNCDLCKSPRGYSAAHPACPPYQPTYLPI